MKTILLTGLEKTNLKAEELLKNEDCLTINFPLQQMVSTEDTYIPDLQFDWVVFTSSSAVNLSTKKFFVKAAKFATVGPSTTQALINKGYESSLAPENNFSAVGLIEKFKKFPGNLNILYPTSTLADDTIETGLNALGHNVYRINSYKPIEIKLDELPEFTDIAFFSGSGVELFHKKFGESALTNKKAVAIGKSTAAAFKKLFGYKPALAKESTVAGVVDSFL